MNDEPMNHVTQSVVVPLHPVTRSRTDNDALRGRKYLRPEEVNGLAKEARKSRNGTRDALMIRMAYEHGLRISELVAMKWQQIDLDAHQVAIQRVKGSISGTHPLQGNTIRELRKLQRQDGRSHGHVFTSERGAPVSIDGFRKMFHRLSERVMGVKWNPHALRHACGYHLINEGVDIRTVQQYLGHSNIQNTVIYTAMSSRAFSKLAF